MLPQSDYNSITTGFNGYTASAGYNLVTGLGTPIAISFVPDLIAYQGAGTVYSGPTVGAIQDSALVNTGVGGGANVNDVFNLFNAMVVTISTPGQSQAVATAPDGNGPASAISSADVPSIPYQPEAQARGMSAVSALPTSDVALMPALSAPGATTGAAVAPAPSASSQIVSIQPLGSSTNLAPRGDGLLAAAALVDTSLIGRADGTEAGLSSEQTMVSLAAPDANPSCPGSPDGQGLDRLMVAHAQRSQVSDVAIDELAGASVMRLVYRPEGASTLPVFPPDALNPDLVTGDLQPHLTRVVSRSRPDWAAVPAVLGLAAGLWAERTAIVDVRKRRRERASSRTKSRA